MLEKILRSNKKMLVSLVGAGGKTTTMFYLAECFKKLDMRVLVTTTTRIFVPEREQYDQWIMDEKIDFKDSNIKNGTIVLAGKGLDEKQKIIGLDIETLDQCYLDGVFDVILVEADGSKRKSIKAPDIHEPVIPKNTTHVVGVIGLDALGKKIDSETVHRVNIFKKITSSKDNEMINEEIIGLLIRHPEGLFKGTPKRAEKIVLLNKAVDDDLIKRANKIKTYVESMEFKVIVRGKLYD